MKGRNKQQREFLIARKAFLVTHACTNTGACPSPKPHRLLLCIQSTHHTAISTDFYKNVRAFIAEWLRLEGTSAGHPIQPPHSSGDTEQVTTVNHHQFSEITGCHKQQSGSLYVPRASLAIK